MTTTNRPDVEAVCHLIGQAKAGELAAENIKKELVWLGAVRESDPFDVKIYACRECGQVFLYCFKQYTSAGWDDDYWTFWIPISEEESEGIRASQSLLESIAALLTTRSHICWHPDGQIFWAESGFPLAPIVFLS